MLIRAWSRLTDTRNPYTLNHLHTEPGFYASLVSRLSENAHSNEPGIHAFRLDLLRLDHHAATPRQ